MAPRWLRRLLGRPVEPIVYLHVGASKTGTTYLQDLMAKNRRHLRDAGCLLPGDARLAQVNGVLQAMAVLRNPESDLATRAPRWMALVREAMEFSGRCSVISSEYLSFLDEERAARLLETLAGAEVHVILTVRDAKSTLPGQWQTSIRNGGVLTFDRYQRGLSRSLRVRAAELPSRKPQRLFQRAQGVPRMLDVWLPLVGPKALHVVTVPPSGSDPGALWNRFAKVLHVRPSVCTEAPKRSNVSLGYPSVEFLRRVNLHLTDMPKKDYFKLVRGFLSRSVLEKRAGVERRAALDQRGMRRTARWNAAIRRAIEERELRVVGSLDDLVTTPAPAPESIPPPTNAELLVAATSCRLGLERLRDHLAAGNDSQRLTLTAADILADAVAEPDDEVDDKVIDEAAHDVAQLVLECAALL